MFKYTATVPDDAPSMQLGAYVRHAFPLLPQYVLRDAFEKRDVKIDGKRCLADTLVTHGSEVTVYTAYHADIPILYEDDHILAIDKPAGVSCDRDAYGSMTVTEWAYAYANNRFMPRLCHRLDNQTTGLLLLAKNDETEKAVREAFAGEQVTKEYLCIVHGTPDPRAAKSIAWLTKDAKRSTVKIGSKQTTDAKQIITSYETLQAGDISLLRVRLHTGRTHQIRSHMAWLGYPLLGDDKYGDRKKDKQIGISRLMLRSVALSFDMGDMNIPINGYRLKAPYELDGIYEELKQRR